MFPCCNLAHRKYRKVTDDGPVNDLELLTKVISTMRVARLGPHADKRARKKAEDPEACREEAQKLIDSGELCTCGCHVTGGRFNLMH